MALWTNHVAIAAPRNGTNSHSVSPSSGTAVAGEAFEPTPGRMLLCVAYGAVTSTTPSGWTLRGSAIENGALYIWTKDEADGGGDDDITVTHNAANYPCIFHFFEFPAGSTWVDAEFATDIGNASAMPSLTGLTGTNLGLAVKAVAGGDGMSGVTNSWAGATELVDTFVPYSSTDGYGYSLGYSEDHSSASFQPSCTRTVDAGTAPTGEAVTFAVTVAEEEPGGEAPANTVAPAITGTPQVGETLTRTAGTWTGTPTPTVAAQWQVSDDGATGWSNVGSPDDPSVVLASGDVDKYFSVLETGSNSEGEGTARSNVIGPVEPAPPLRFTLYTSANGHGGEITSTEVNLGPDLMGLLGEITAEEAASGFSRFWLLYVKNDEAAKKVRLEAWFSEHPEGDQQQWAVGAVSEASGEIVTGEEDNATMPVGVDLLSPSSEETAADLGVVDEDDFLGFYLAFAAVPGLQPDDDPYAVQIEFKLSEVAE